MIPEVEPQAVQAFGDDGIFVRHEEHVVAAFGPERLAQRLLLSGREELGDRPGELVFFDEEVSEPTGAAGRRDGGQLVELAAREVPEIPDGDAAHRPAGLDRAAEDLELRGAGYLADVSQLQAEADVGLVGAEASKRLCVGEAREGFVEDLLAAEFLYDLDIEALDELQDLLLGCVAHLEVELGVLGLPVASLVLIAQSPGYLEVALEASDHEELLELLGRLREGVELPRIEAARDQVVAGALRGRFGQERRLDLDEATLLEVIAHVLDDPVAKEDVVPHPGTPQVEVAVLQAEQLIHGPVAVDLERRRLGGAKHPQIARLDLDLAGRQVGVLVALGAPDDLTLDRDGILGPELLSCREDRVAFRVEGHLGYPPAIAQIYKDQTPMVPPAMHPSGEPNPLADVLLAQLSGGPCPVGVGCLPAFSMQGSYLLSAAPSHGPQIVAQTREAGAFLYFERLVARFSCT